VVTRVLQSAGSTVDKVLPVSDGSAQGSQSKSLLGTGLP
jgi:hypothetical protein